jgi:polygalacturonase/rhamnogalacturonyl hydrolase YesR
MLILFCIFVSNWRIFPIRNKNYSKTTSEKVVSLRRYNTHFLFKNIYQIMRYIKILLLAMILPLCVHAQEWNEPEYQQINRQIHLPEISTRSLSITTFGARTSASAAINQKAINKAITLMSAKGGGRVIIPEGTWNTGAIRLKSHVNLVVEKGATVHFAFEPKLYPLVRTSWEGLACWNYSPCIYAYQATDVAITGKGTIDGGGSNQTWWQWNGSPRFGYQPGITKESQKLGSRARLEKMGEDDVPANQRRFGMGQGLRPQLINFNQCERILIKDVQLLNSPFWVIHPLLSKSITVDSVRVYNDGPNGDGCDPEACENVLIQNCFFHTGDDCIAIKSGRNNDGRLWGKPSRNIIIRNCQMADGHGGIVIGSEISGGCENVYAENCQMDSPNLQRVLRIKTNNCRGGIIQNIHLRNITVGQCKEAVMRINLNYEPKEDCYRGFEPVVHNISMENVTCQKSEYGVLVNGLDSIVNVYDVIIKNCRFNGVTKDPVKITGKTRNIHFDQLFINNSLVLNTGENPYKHYSEWLTYSEMKRAPHPYLLDFAETPRWSYVMGIEQEGMLDTYLRYGGDSIIQYLKEYPEKMIDDKGKVIGYNYNAFNLDNVRTAKYILRMQDLFPRKGNVIALKTFFKQLQHQPRTADGVFWHKAIYANQVWLDGIFMGLPFYTAYAHEYLSTKKAAKIYTDAINQILTTDKHTYDPQTKLWKHAWDSTHSQFWANKENGQSKHTWGRALGWYAMALTECLEQIPQDFPRRDSVVSILRRVMDAVILYQDFKTGLWYDVMDVKAPENYLEATASSMFTYVLLRGSRLGYLPEKDRIAGIKAYKGILSHFIRVNPDKTISLTGCCAVSGLGPGPGPFVKKPNYRRDGSFKYYMSEPVRDNDAKGIGPFIWASLEMEKIQ